MAGLGLAAAGAFVPVVWLVVLSAVSKRKMRLGCHTLRKAVRAISEDDGRGDVGQLRADVVGGEELHHGERAAAHQHGRPGSFTPRQPSMIAMIQNSTRMVMKGNWRPPSGR